MWNKIQNWLMNVLAKWIWIIIMFPIRAFIGLCIAISKNMPEKVEVPYEIRKKDREPNGAKQWF
tara:strand:+ start:801 stop:992 length:192 start_codon:yes stop_codon:yes gene_type:complete